MKRFISLILAAAMLLSLAGAAEELPDEIELADTPEATWTPLGDIELELEDGTVDGLADLELEDVTADGLAVSDLDGALLTETPESAAPAPNSGDVFINETNFPDETFRNLVEFNADLNHDLFLSEEEAGKVTAIYLHADEYKDISSLKGIEYFYALKSLTCANNQLTSLDLSRCTALEYISFWYCERLASLNVRGCAALAKIFCVGSALTELDVSMCPALTELECAENKLKSLDVSMCPALTELDCHSTKLKSLDVSKCTALTKLSCVYGQLKSLDVSGCPALTYLSCGGNKLTSLDVSGCAALTNLSCGENQLASLNVSKCKALETLYCEENQLAGLDVSKCKALETLHCEKNSLASLDVSGCPKLVTAVKRKSYDGAYIDEYANYHYSFEHGEDGPFDDYELWCDLNVAIRPMPTWFFLEACTVTVGDQVYTGKAVKPAVTVKYGKKKLTEDKHYTVTFKNNTAVGKASAVVKGKGKCVYKKSASVAFKINPKAVKGLTLKAGEKQFTATWKQAAGVTGYLLEYSPKSVFSTFKKVRVQDEATLKTTVKGLKTGKKYYVRICGYKTVKGKNYYSKWSALKKVTIE